MIIFDLFEDQNQLSEFAPPEDHNWDDGELDDPVGRAAYRAAMTIKAWRMDRTTAINTLASYPQLTQQLQVLEPAILTNKKELKELLDWAVSNSRISDEAMMDLSESVAEGTPLTRDARRELVAPSDRDRIRRELWKYVGSLDQEGMSNRAHAMAHSCPTWGRLYRQFHGDVSYLLGKAPTEQLAQALQEIQSQFQGVTETSPKKAEKYLLDVTAQQTKKLGGVQPDMYGRIERAFGPKGAQRKRGVDRALNRLHGKDNLDEATGDLKFDTMLSKLVASGKLQTIAKQFADVVRQFPQYKENDKNAEYAVAEFPEMFPNGYPGGRFFGSDGGAYKEILQTWKQIGPSAFAEEDEDFNDDSWHNVIGISQDYTDYWTRLNPIVKSLKAFPDAWPTVLKMVWHELFGGGVEQGTDDINRQGVAEGTTKIHSDRDPKLTGFSFQQLDRLCESAGDDSAKFDRAIKKNLALPAWTNTLELYGVYARKLNAVRSMSLTEGTKSDIEQQLFDQLSQRSLGSMDSASVGDRVSLLHLATLTVPGHKVVAKLTGFLTPKQIVKIVNTGLFQQLEFADGSRYPEKDGGDIFQQTQTWNMTKLFPSADAASKAFMFYVLEGQKLSDVLDFQTNVDQGVAEGNPWANVIHSTDIHAEKDQRELKHKQAAANSARVLKNHSDVLDPKEVDLLQRYNLHHRGNPGVRFDRLDNEKAEQLIQNVLRFNKQGMAESAGPGEYYIWTVHFANPEKNPPRRCRVWSDEFSIEIPRIEQFYAKKGLKVVDVDTDTGLHSDYTESASVPEAKRSRPWGKAAFFKNLEQQKKQDRQANTGLTGLDYTDVQRQLKGIGDRMADKPTRVSEVAGYRDSAKDSDHAAVEQAIARRIMVGHKDLLLQYGPQQVMQAVEAVADDVGPTDEIGTSDVSGWVNQVKQILGAVNEAINPAQQAAIAVNMKKQGKKPKQTHEAQATRTRLDPACWSGKRIGTPKTKVKNGVRVNNCVPK